MKLLEGVSPKSRVWMSHGDRVEAVAAGFAVVGRSEPCPVAAGALQLAELAAAAFGQRPEAQPVLAPIGHEPAAVGRERQRSRETSLIASHHGWHGNSQRPEGQRLPVVGGGGNPITLGVEVEKTEPATRAPELARTRSGQGRQVPQQRLAIALHLITPSPIVKPPAVESGRDL